MKLPILILSLLSISTASEDTWDDQGYQYLCGHYHRCICPRTRMDTFLDCKQSNISTLPTNIYFPARIETISFQNNEISVIKDITFYNGHGVKNLDLSYNRIRFIGSSSFVGFQQLVDLKLSHNELSSLPVKLLDGLHNLQLLDLSYNKLQTFLSNVFQPTTQLVELKLKFNPLMSLDDISFEHLPSLQKLELERTGLSTLPDNLFAYTPHLKSLSLESNQFTDVPTRALQKAGELKLLDLSGNLIREVKPHAFHGLYSLTSLFINNQNGLLAIRKHAFCDLPNLKTLQCSYNTDLVYVDDGAFRRNDSKFAVHLEQFHLRDNALENLPEGLLPWKEVPYLDFRGNPWRCDCNLKWMAEYHEQRYQENIRCATPSHYENLQVSKLKEKDFVCYQYKHYFTDHLFYVILMVLLIVVAIPVSFTLVIFCFRRVGQKIRAKHQRRYTLVVPKVDKIDLEWDHSVDP